MNKLIWAGILSPLLVGAVEVKEVCFKIVENVLYCKSVITEKSLVPQVCGRCELEVKEGKLYIKKVEGCPRYDAWVCQTSAGEFFLINNLNCTPSEQKGTGEIERKGKKEEFETYKVRVMGEFCFNLLKKKFDVLEERMDEAIIRARRKDLKRLPHCVISYEKVVNF